MPRLMKHYYLDDEPRLRESQLAMGKKVRTILDQGMAVGKAVSECTPEEVENAKVDDELSYGFWHSPQSIQKSRLADWKDPVMAIPSKIGKWEFQGMAQLKIAAKVPIAVPIPIPAPNASEHAVLINGVSGLHVVAHNTSFWHRLVNIFKSAFAWAFEQLLVLWRATIGELEDVFKKAKEAGREPRFPWDSDKKERIKLSEQGGAAPFELQMDPTTRSDLNDPVNLKQGWTLERDSRQVVVYFLDTKYSDNDGHSRLNLYFYAK